jgi:hypothetical protein
MENRCGSDGVFQTMRSAAPETKRDRVFPITLILISGVVIVATFRIQTLGLPENHDPGPRALPWFLAGLLMIGGLYELAAALLTKPPASAPQKTQEPPAEPAHIRNTLILLGSLILYFVAMPWIGFFVATLCFSISMMRLLGTGWIFSAIASVAMLLTVHLLFVQLFKVQLPAGVLRFPF